MTGIPILHIFLCGLHNTPPPIISVLQAVLSASPLCFFNVPLFSCQVIIEEPMRLTPSPRQQRFRWEGRWCAYVRHTHSDTTVPLTEHKAACTPDDLAQFALFRAVCFSERSLHAHTWLWHANWSLISEYDQRSHTHTGKSLWRISKGVMVFIQS